MTRMQMFQRMVMAGCAAALLAACGPKEDPAVTKARAEAAAAAAAQAAEERNVAAEETARVEAVVAGYKAAHAQFEQACAGMPSQRSALDRQSDTAAVTGGAPGRLGTLANEEAAKLALLKVQKTLAADMAAQCENLPNAIAAVRKNAVEWGQRKAALLAEANASLATDDWLAGDRLYRQYEANAKYGDRADQDLIRIKERGDEGHKAYGSDFGTTARKLRHYAVLAGKVLDAGAEADATVDAASREKLPEWWGCRSTSITLQAAVDKLAPGTDPAPGTSDDYRNQLKAQSRACASEAAKVCDQLMGGGNCLLAPGRELPAAELAGAPIAEEVWTLCKASERCNQALGFAVAYCTAALFENANRGDDALRFSLKLVAADRQLRAAQVNAEEIESLQLVGRQAAHLVKRRSLTKEKNGWLSSALAWDALFTRMSLDSAVDTCGAVVRLHPRAAALVTELTTSATGAAAWHPWKFEGVPAQEIAGAQLRERYGRTVRASLAVFDAAARAQNYGGEEMVAKRQACSAALKSGFDAGQADAYRSAVAQCASDALQVCKTRSSNGSVYTTCISLPAKAADEGAMQ